MPRRRSRAAPGKRFLAHEEGVEEGGKSTQSFKEVLRDMIDLCPGKTDDIFRLIEEAINVEVGRARNEEQEKIQSLELELRRYKHLAFVLVDGATDQLNTYGTTDPIEAATAFAMDLRKAVVELADTRGELVGCKTELKGCTDTTGFVKGELNKQLEALAQAEDAANSGWLSKWFSERKQ